MLEVELSLHHGSRDRFRGFADLYDANRPSPPEALGPLLARYANVKRPAVVDIGSGTGLSSRWAAKWAESVIGIEPNAEMRSVAETRPAQSVKYMDGIGHDTGLDASTADVVTVVQAMHWMDPGPTLTEIGRVLRPGGLLAAIDVDWPPVSGVAPAEMAWKVLYHRIRVLEARITAGQDGSLLRRSIPDDDPLHAVDETADPHGDRVLPAGLRAWSKSGHLHRMDLSGQFQYTREIALSEQVEGGAERFCGLMYSQGSYQGLRRRGLTDAEIGADEFEQRVKEGFASARVPGGLTFTWYVRIGVKER